MSLAIVLNSNGAMRPVTFDKDTIHKYIWPAPLTPGSTARKHYMCHGILFTMWYDTNGADGDSPQQPNRAIYCFDSKKSNIYGPVVITGTSRNKHAPGLSPLQCEKLLNHLALHTPAFLTPSS